jgi:hypothetical protein
VLRQQTLVAYAMQTARARALGAATGRPSAMLQRAGAGPLRVAAAATRRPATWQVCAVAAPAAPRRAPQSAAALLPARRTQATCLATTACARLRPTLGAAAPRGARAAAAAAGAALVADEPAQPPNVFLKKVAALGVIFMGEPQCCRGRGAPVKPPPAAAQEG